MGFEKPQRDEQGKRKSKQTNDERLRLKVDHVLLAKGLRLIQQKTPPVAGRGQVPSVPLS
ncbi:MAG TPA: hypothetical protein DCY41_04960 [Opitutae bacterium]|nr:hypothetical protein [Opitutae bacterium]